MAAAEFQNFTDREIVDQLWARDKEAWEMVMVKTVIPTARMHWDIIQDRGLSMDELLSMLFVQMIAEKKLNNFKFGCPLVYWMRYYVKKAIYNFCKKNPRPMSDEAISSVLPEEGRDPNQIKEELEMAQHCFSKLWKTNPMRAYVHLLKIQEEMSSREVMKLLNVSSEDNVNKIFSRALDDMRDFRDDLTAGAK